VVKNYIEEFWALVDVGDLDACWLWQGSVRGAGYGQCSSHAHPSRIAIRAAFELWYGVPLGELRCCHSCDTPLCTNPLHLFAGTAKDNTQDSIAKGRFRLPPHHTNTQAAREALARRYADPEFRAAQGARIAAGWARVKQRNQAKEK